MGDFLLNVEKRDPNEPWTFENGLHFTMIFNTFVFMQIFNEINARKIGPNEFNVFSGIFGNGFFVLIMVVTIGVQFALVQYGGYAVKCTPLTVKEHLICVGIGSLSLVIGVVSKFVPLSIFSCLSVHDDLPSDDQWKAKKSLTKSFRQSRALSRGGQKTPKAGDVVQVHHHSAHSAQQQNT